MRRVIREIEQIIGEIEAREKVDVVKIEYDRNADYLTVKNKNGDVMCFPDVEKRVKKRK